MVMPVTRSTTGTRLGNTEPTSVNSNLGNRVRDAFRFVNPTNHLRLRTNSNDNLSFNVNRSQRHNSPNIANTRRTAMLPPENDVASQTVPAYFTFRGRTTQQGNPQHDIARTGYNLRSGVRTPRAARGDRRRRSRRADTDDAMITPPPPPITNGIRIDFPYGADYWYRGQGAEVRWFVLDDTITHVRIEVCNSAWREPTIIGQRVANNGNYQWMRVAWGLPPGEGYYLNIYDASNIDVDDGLTNAEDLKLLARSSGFIIPE